MLSRHKVLSGLLIALWSANCLATETNAGNGGDWNLSPVSLSELAAKADLVALAQVKDTDYVYTRAFPSEGSAFLKILIAYKISPPAPEIIEVYEKGLHPNECYFENPTVLEEGRRYLVFLRMDPQDAKIFRGLAEGCALEVLVTENNRYALKYPVKGLNLSDRLDDLAAEVIFQDSYAVVAEENLAPAERQGLLARKLIIPYEGKFKYTHGIDLSAVRQLIGPEALKPNRAWR